MRWRAEVSRLMVPVAAPAARRASWYWRIWIRGERGGSRVPAEEGGEMGDPAAGGRGVRWSSAAKSSIG